MYDHDLYVFEWELTMLVIFLPFISDDLVFVDVSTLIRWTTRTTCGNFRKKTKNIKIRSMIEGTSRAKTTAKGITGPGLDLVQPKWASV